jgi:dihydrofolate reductase
MYQTMAVWETDPSFAAASPVYRDFALIWQAANKIVYSRTLQTVSTARTRLERDFDPAAIRQLKATAAQDLLIGGPGLASHAFRAGLVDECHLVLVPFVVGGGKQSLPTDSILELKLLDERRFDNGMLYVRYQVKP